jgi:regulator of protease activity HflC (stomatin/prohibitin superfamily)
MTVAALLIPMIVLVLAWLVSGLRVVHPHERAIVERFGKYRRTLDPGVRPTLRFIDHLVRVDIRERVEDVGVEALNRDKIVLHLDVAVFYRCVDPRAFAYDVADAPLAINRLTETEARSLVGMLTLDQLVGADDVLTAELDEALRDAVSPWGVVLTRVEVAGVEPPEDLMEALIDAATAERDRVAAAVTSQKELQVAIGQTEAEQRRRIAEAEADRRIAVLRAEGEADAVRILADADRYRQQSLAHAQADAVRIVSAAIHAGSDGTDLIAVKYLEVLSAVRGGQVDLVAGLEAQREVLRAPDAEGVGLPQHLPVNGQPWQPARQDR